MKKAALTEWIFPNLLHPEKPMSPTWVYHHMKTLLKHAGLEPSRFHDLRHTFATLALEGNPWRKRKASGQRGESKKCHPESRGLIFLEMALASCSKAELENLLEF